MDHSTEFERIHVACQDVFKAKVTVQSRALQALVAAKRRVTWLNTEISIASDFEFFQQVVAASPACAEALMKEGVSLNDWQASSSKVGQQSRVLDLRDYSKLLTDIFVPQFPSTQVTCH
nr:hypothetical protein [uncultured Rhizobium sp.]